ncbi:MAG: CHAT domain-containing protein [Nibricoccus sp.]
MKTILRSTGVRVELADELEIVPTAAGPDRRGFRPARGPIPMPSAGSSENSETDAIARTLRGQELILVDTILVEPRPLSPGQARAIPPQDGYAVKTAIDLAANESVAVLAEQDGCYAWNFESDSPGAGAAPAARNRGPSGPRQAVLQIRLGAKNPGRAQHQRGLISDFIVSRAKILVFKFVAHFVVERIGDYLEKDIRTGIMRMSGDDPLGWRLLPAAEMIGLPADRPARVLLFVHGTFSSTKGGYGALGATPWGRAFLQSARANYDAVIGFEHATLTVDPLTNARDLERLLFAHLGTRAEPVRFDIICHSRGGIVTRSLLEHLKPGERFPWKFERVIFAGAVNAGTELANPDNWRALIDLYTNLAAGACRAIATFPAATPAATLIAECISSLGAFVKVLATETITAGALPGLAAMEPAGKFIQELNQTQPGQPTAENSLYYAITSEFNAALALDQDNKLARQFLLLLADGFMDRLMQRANDLVVHVDSMTSIDSTGKFVKDTLAFGSNGLVYHTNYFLQPQVTSALARWLELESSQAASPTRIRGLIEPGTTYRSVPARVDTNISVLAAEELGADVVDQLKIHAPSYVVLERFDQSSLLRYAFPTEEVIAMADKHPQAPLKQSLDLHEFDASTQLETPFLTTSLQLSARSAVGQRIIALDAGEVTGVAELKVIATPIAALVGFAGDVAKFQTDSHRITARRTLPSFKSLSSAELKTVAGASAAINFHKLSSAMTLASRMIRGERSVPPAPAAAPDVSIERPPSMSPASLPASAPGPAETGSPPSTFTCHVLAQMNDEVVLDEKVTVDVKLSREQILQSFRAVSGTGSGPIKAGELLTIELIPTKNFRLAGKARFDEPPPEPGQPLERSFDLTPTDVGEGAVMVRVRQCGQPFVSIPLTCRIITQRTRPPARRPEKAVIVEPPTGTTPLHQLTIFEIERGGQKLYQFIIDSPEFGWKHSYESRPIQGDRDAYVRGLYDDIERRWLESDDDFDEFQRELRDMGAKLWDELVPPEVQSALWEHRGDIHEILVFSEEPFIPWELVHLKDRGKGLPSDTLFFAQLGVVRWLHNVGWPTETLRAREQRCFYVIPNYLHSEWVLPQAQEEAVFLAQTFEASAIDPHPPAVRALFETAGQFDLLHFACHGVADQKEIGRAELMLEGKVSRDGKQYVPERLRASTIENGASLVADDGTKPIVVLNACQVGRAGYNLTSIGGFSRAFLRKGAGMFVAASWAVGDRPARTFTEELYTRLKAGDTLAHASSAAREVARDAREATWLAYTVYGNPHARLQLP